ncbi:MAG: SDR family NAD(P)-dependent oxidoreductase [Rhodobacteraceae bacterium]|jgi:NAD(P)-dependent dehydrogenase (short-subunit alcohol dehydrogenase family)|nr:SDR family NAD(P)-dependent oxidoreductase [Paracoccaceae bacterium]
MTAGAAVVVGAGPGLGLALVRRFAAAGMRVAMIARRAGALAGYRAGLAAEGLDALPLAADAGEPASLAAALDAARAAIGPPDVMIYNAALIEPARFVTPSGIAEARYAGAPGWRAHGAPVDRTYLGQSFAVNVAGALQAAQAAAPDMVAAGRGTILFTGGVLAFGPWIEWGPVALGKAALRSLGQSLALELGPSGVQVAVVAIHGTMARGGPYDPERVAGLYWQTHLRPAAEWTVDVHFRADAADGRDPDR